MVSEWRLLELAAQTSPTVAQARRDEERVRVDVDRRLEWTRTDRDRRAAAAALRLERLREAAAFEARQERARQERTRAARALRDEELTAADGLVERCHDCGSWRLAEVIPDGSLRPLWQLHGRPVVPHDCGDTEAGRRDWPAAVPPAATHTAGPVTAARAVSSLTRDVA